MDFKAQDRSNPRGQGMFFVARDEAVTFMSFPGTEANEGRRKRGGSRKTATRQTRGVAKDSRIRRKAAMLPHGGSRQ